MFLSGTELPLSPFESLSPELLPGLREAGFVLVDAPKTDLNIFHLFLIVGCDSESGNPFLDAAWFADGLLRSAGEKGTSPSNESKTGGGLSLRITIIRPGAGVQAADDKGTPWPCFALD